MAAQYTEDAQLIPPELPTIEGRAREVSVSAGGARFAVGARVFHDKFGYGRVLLAEGQKLTVDFEHSGAKKVVDSFLKGA